jgi:hypothetical protein
MAISVTDIRFEKALTNNDLATNGGRRDPDTVITNNVLNNLFPNFSNDDRTSGKARYRKCFIHNNNGLESVLQNTELWIKTPTSGEDYCQIIVGTDTDTQTDAAAYTEWCGVGSLYSGGASGETSATVLYDTNSGVFSGEDTWVYFDDSTNRSKHKVIGTPSWAGNYATFTFSGEIAYNYDTENTQVSTIVDLGDLEPSYDNFTEVTSSGTYDEDTYLSTYNAGTVSDHWTLTFSSTTNFTVIGTITGSVGSGDINTSFQPSNGSSYYFKLDKNGWGGTWASGERVTFDTIHAAAAIWIKRVCPAGAASYANSKMRLEIKGESA